MELSGAQILMKSLEDEGVRTIFGLPGGPVIPLYDAIYDSPIKHILVRHEQAAAHAADGFARAGGGVGVCVSTSGPGATNLITGIATANHDSSPLVAITGQVASSMIGTDFFQEAHIMGIALPIVKHSMQARSAADVPTMVADAFRIASTGRPGPVLIDMPVDVQTGRAEYERPTGTFFPAYRPAPPEDLSRATEAADIIRRAERPVIIAGNGVNIGGAYRELEEMASQLEIPVVTTLLGKGVLSSASEWSIGMVGMHGHAAANRAVLNADVVIALGTRFSDRSTGKASEFAPKARVIHVDIDSAEIGKTVSAHIWLTADVKRAAHILTSEARGHDSAARRAWRDEIRRFAEAEPLRRETRHGDICSWQVLDAIDDITHGEAVITTEVGQHQMMTALYHEPTSPRRFITSGGQGTMGFGIPASIGAHFAQPDLPVICIAGDGSAMMNIQELDTYARYGLPIKVIVMDNGCLGMVRQWQQLFYSERYSNTIYPRRVDYAGVARAMGVEAWDVSDPAEVRPTLERAISTDGPALVCVKIPQDENVYPMVPAGASFEKMIV